MMHMVGGTNLIINNAITDLIPLKYIYLQELVLFYVHMKMQLRLKINRCQDCLNLLKDNNNK